MAHYLPPTWAQQVNLCAEAEREERRKEDKLMKSRRRAFVLQSRENNKRTTSEADGLAFFSFARFLLMAVTPCIGYFWSLIMCSKNQNGWLHFRRGTEWRWGSGMDALRQPKSTESLAGTSQKWPRQNLQPPKHLSVASVAGMAIA